MSLKEKKRTDAKNLSFITLCLHLFVLDLCNAISFYEILCCVTLHYVLCYITFFRSSTDQSNTLK